MLADVIIIDEIAMLVFYIFLTVNALGIFALRLRKIGRSKI
jgi:hypothetical protein